jgi:drug/metabolite transporter (DMT)-like permease
MVAVWYVVMCLIYSTTYLAIKVGMEDGVPPFYMAAWRFGVAGLVIAAYWAWKKGVFPKSWRVYREMALQGLLMTVCPFAALFWSEQYITSGMAALLVATAPVFVGILGKMDRWQWVGAAVTMAGIYLVAAHDLGGAESGKALAAKAVLVASELFFAYGLVRSKRLLSTGISPVLFNGVQMLFASLGLFSLSFVWEQPLSTVWSGAAIWSVLYLAIVASVVASGIFYWLVEKTNPLFPTTWTYVAPIAAMGLGAVVLGEPLTVSMGIGALLVIGGVLVINRKLFGNFATMGGKGGL